VASGVPLSELWAQLKQAPVLRKNENDYYFPGHAYSIIAIG